jgi:hypothetical protein
MDLVYHPSTSKPLIIGGQAISVTFAHHHCFIPVYVPDEYAIGTYVDSTGSRVQLSYWDETAYAFVYPPTETFDPPTWAIEQSSSMPAADPSQHTVSQAPESNSKQEFELDAFYASIEAQTAVSQPGESGVHKRKKQKKEAVAEKKKKLTSVNAEGWQRAQQRRLLHTGESREPDASVRLEPEADTSQDAEIIAVALLM